MLDTAVVLIFLTVWIYTILFLAESDDAVEKKNRFVNRTDVLHLLTIRNKNDDALRRVRITALIGLALSLLFLAAGLVFGDSLPSSITISDGRLLILYPLIVIIYMSYLYKRLYQLQVDSSAHKNFYRTYFKSYEYLPRDRKQIVITTDVVCLVLLVAMLTVSK